MTELTHSSSQSGFERRESGPFESADFYDERVCVRSPYTGQLGSPRIVVDYVGLTSSQCSHPTTRTKPLQVSVPPEHDAGYSASESRLGRFRIVGIGFAIAVGLGVAAFSVMGSRNASVVEDPMAVELAGAMPHPGNVPEAAPAPEEEPDTPEANDTVTSLKSPIMLSSVAEEDVEEAASAENSAPSDPSATEAVGTTPKDTVEEPGVQEQEALQSAAATDGVKGDISDVAEGAEEGSQSPDGYEALLKKAKKARRGKARIAFLREAIEANPKGDEALASLSVLLMDLPKSRKEALELAERAVSVNDQNAAAWLVIGYIKQMGGAMVEAKEAYGKCAAAPGPKRYVRECRRLI